jgi:hypothetical protein
MSTESLGSTTCPERCLSDASGTDVPASAAVRLNLLANPGPYLVGTAAPESTARGADGEEERHRPKDSFNTRS